MKIAIPTDGKKGLDDKVAEHFGRCLTYTFLNEEGEVLEIIDNLGEHGGGKDLPPQLLKKEGVDVLLCRELGPRALNLCSELGIEVYISPVKEVKEIFKMWQDNKLKKAGGQDACQEHKI